LKIGDLLRALLDDEVVDGDEAGSGEAEFGEHQVDAVQPEGEFVFELGEVGLLEGRAVADDEGALTLVRVLERGEATDALASPRMQIRGRELRQAANPVVGVFDGLEEGGWEEGAFHLRIDEVLREMALICRTILACFPHRFLSINN